MAMTNEEREALIARARATVHPNERQTRALLSALDEARRDLSAARTELLDLDLVLPVACGSRVDAAQHLVDAGARAERERDEARGQLAALHAAATPVADASSDIGVQLDTETAVQQWDAFTLALSDPAAAAKAHEARVREPVERERDAAIARADAAERDRDTLERWRDDVTRCLFPREDGETGEIAAREATLEIDRLHGAETTLSNLRALRLGDQLDEMRAERNKAREERDTLAAALAEVRRRFERLTSCADHAEPLDWCQACAAEVATMADLQASFVALPADLATQLDARVRAEAGTTVAQIQAWCDEQLCQFTIVRTGNDEWSVIASNPGGHVKKSAPSAQAATAALFQRFAEIDAAIAENEKRRVDEAEKGGA